MPYKEGNHYRAKVTFRGQRYTKKCQTKRDADAWEVRKLKELKKNEKRSPSGLDLLTFCSKYSIYAERFVKSTYNEKRALCRRILTAWGPLCLVEDITPEMIQAYLDDQASARSNNASNKDLRNLSAMFTYLRDILGPDLDPLKKIKKRPHSRSVQYVPPIEDVKKVFAVATPAERVFLDCYIQTGARRSAVFRWTWNDDINFQRKKVRLGSRKTKDGSMKYQWVDMSSALYQSLKWLWENRKFPESPFVFVNDNPCGYGQPFKTRQRFLARLCDRAGVKEFGYHSLRRFVASVLMDSKKVSLKEIQMLLGHSNLTTTEKYVYNLREDLSEAVGILSDTFDEVDFSGKRHIGKAHKKNGDFNH
jgi:integrase